MRVNYGLAALALLLSTTLWILVVNDQNPERVDIAEPAIPVEISKVPPGLVVMSGVEPVRFKIRAPKDHWTTIRSSSFRASIDLSRLGPGIHAVPVVPEASDPQVKVLEVVPSTVSIRLEEIREQTIPVKVNLIGNVPFGYVYGVPTVEPEVVVASGPASLVQTVETASVDVRLEGISVDIDSAFHPLPVDSSGSTVRSVQLTPQTVKIRIPVQQQVSYKQVGVRAFINGDVAPGYWVESVEVDPPTVTVVGDPKVLAGINFLDTTPVNINGASSSVVQELGINVPQGVSLLQQQTVNVQVNVSTLQTSQVVRVAPKTLNLDSKLRIEGSPSFIEVTIQGPAPIMQGLKSDSIAVDLDVDGLGEGVHELKPTVSTPAGVRVVSVNPETVSITLSPIPTSTSVPTAGSPSADSGMGTATPSPTPPNPSPTPINPTQ